MEDNNQQQNQNGQQNYTQPQNENTNQNYTKQSNENINQNYNGQPNGYANQNYTAQPNEYANPNYAQYAQPNYARPQNGYTQANYAQQQYNNPQVEEKKESGKAPVILRILSFFIPLLGLILFIANISENKEYAKSCGIPALIAFIIAILIIPIAFVIIGLVIFGLASSSDIAYNRSYTDDYGYYYNINSSFDDYDM